MSEHDDKMIGHAIILSRTMFDFMLATAREEGVPDREVRAMVILSTSMLVANIAKQFSSDRRKAMEGLDLMQRTAESALDKAYELDRHREVH